MLYSLRRKSGEVHADCQLYLHTRRLHTKFCVLCLCTLREWRYFQWKNRKWTWIVHIALCLCTNRIISMQQMWQTISHKHLFYMKIWSIAVLETVVSYTHRTDHVIFKRRVFLDVHCWFRFSFSFSALCHVATFANERDCYNDRVESTRNIYIQECKQTKITITTQTHLSAHKYFSSKCLYRICINKCRKI